MIEIFDGIIQDSLGLVECIDINKVFVIKIHFVDVCHDAFEFLLFAGLNLLGNVGLVYDWFLGGFVSTLFGLASHSNIKYEIISMYSNID
jgi:hypothetical protein